MRQYRDPFKKVEEKIQIESETRIIEQEQIVASIPTKLSELENDVGFITEGGEAGEIPTKTSQLENDSGFITESTLLENVEDLGFAKGEDLPTKTSELLNDAGFIGLASVPSKVSQLENDMEFITSDFLPTKNSQLENDMGYIDNTAIPRFISQLQNDVGYITESENAVFFNKNGIITGRMATFIDVFETNADGIFTADFSMVGFKESPYVIVSTETQTPASDTATGNATYVSVFKDSITTSGCSGKVKLASSAGLLAAMVNITAGAGVKVTVEAKGII